MYYEKFDEIYETFKVEIYKPVLFLQADVGSVKCRSHYARIKQ